MLRFVTAGESHGKCLVAVIEGLPSGLPINREFINSELHRRQMGYGRGARMRIEKDQVELTSGVRHGKSLGSPISIRIENRDWPHWEIAMAVDPVEQNRNLRAVTRPRPGHADLPGALKYQSHDVRDILERASARETAARVAIGAFCKLFLQEFGVKIGSHVLAIGPVHIAGGCDAPETIGIFEIDDKSPLRCADKAAEQRMMATIDDARKSGDTLGGILEVIASPIPPGLGSHTQWDRKLDGLLAQAIMSIHAAKAVEIGSGVSAAGSYGSAVHDEIFYDAERRSFYRKTNRAGGLEGGITNGADLRIRAYMKPIPTLRKPLMSVDLNTKEPFEAAFERSDVCVVPAAAVIAEAMTAIVLAGAFLEKFGGDSLQECKANFANYIKMVWEF